MNHPSDPSVLSTGKQVSHAAFDQAAVGIAHMAADGRWVLVNQKLCQILGYAREELLALSLEDHFHPDALSEVRGQIWQLLSGESDTLSNESRFLRKNGDIVWVNLTISRVRKRDRSPDYFVAVVEDITRRKAAEMALQASEQNIRSLYHAMNEGMARHELILDEAGEPVDYRILEVNPAFANILGLAKERVEGQLASIVYSQNPPPYLDIYQEVALRGVGTRFETDYDPMGKSFSISVFSPKQNHFATVFSDISERTLVERDLNRALSDLNRERGLLKSLFQTLPDLIWLKDVEGVYLACNPSFEIYMGARESEIIGKTDYDFQPSELADEFRKNDLIALRNAGPTTNEEWVTFASDGHKALMETTKTPMKDSKGGIIGVLGIAHDITHRKQAEQAIVESSQRYEAVLSTTKEGFLVVETEGNIVDVNQAYCRFSGYSRDELLGMHVTQLDVMDGFSDVRQRIDEIIEAGSLLFETEHLGRDGTAYPVEVSVSYSPIHDGRLFCFIRDIRDRKEIEKISSLRRRLGEMVYTDDRDKLLQTALDTAEEITGSRIGFFHFVDPDQEHVALQTWSTRTLQEMCYLNGEDLHYPVSQAGVWADCIHQKQAIIHNDYEALPHKNGLPAGHAPVTRELTVPVIRDNRIVAVMGVGNKPDHYDEHDLSLVTRIANMAFDFVEHYQAEKKIQFMAYHDVLTGLPNRQLLADRLQQAIPQARRSQQLLAICYIDLDGFKPVNDRYGHEVGDKLLVQAGKRLRGELREGDTLARLGGDEFVLLLGGLRDIYNGEEIIRRVLAGINEPFEIEQHRVHISASIGVTFSPQDDCDADTLLRHADQAMYKAKQNGKCTYSLYDPIEDHKVHEHRRAINEFEQAMDKAQLRLHYQPRIDLRTGQLFSVEALVRWQHPVKGLLPPGNFLSTIQDSHLEIALDEWVIQTALEQHMIWRDQGMCLPVSVNLCPRHIQQQTFPEDLRKLTARFPADITRHLELEILETGAIGDTSEVAEIMTTCKQELGISFSLDDFGTGYSSLTYFHRLPISVLKVDQNFVRGMLTDSRDQDIVEGVLRLAEALKRPVVAEGVETIEHGLMLLQLGCQFAQGYGIARPMPAETVLDWAEGWKANGDWQRLNAIASEMTEPYDLSVAIFALQNWLARIQRFMLSPSTAEPVETDEKSCQFSRWYFGIGEVRYGSRPQFPFLRAKHSQALELAGEILAQAKDQPTGSEASRLAALNASSEELIAMLRKLARP